MNHHPKTQLSSNPDPPDSTLHPSSFGVRSSLFNPVSFLRVHPQARQWSKWRTGFSVLLFFRITLLTACFSMMYSQWPTEPYALYHLAENTSQHHTAFLDNNGGVLLRHSDPYDYSTGISLIDKHGLYQWTHLISMDPEWDGLTAVFNLIDNEQNIFISYRFFDYIGYQYWMDTYITQTMVKKLDYNGNIIWGNDEIRVSLYEGFQLVLDVKSDNAGGCYILFHECQDSFNDSGNIRVQRISSQGERLFGDRGLNIFEISSAPDFGDISLTTKPNGEFYVRGTTIRKFSAEGELIWMNNYTGSNGENWYITESIDDGLDGFYIFRRQYPSNDTIFVNRIDEDGEYLWGEFDVQLPTNNILNRYVRRQLGLALNSDRSVTVIYKSTFNTSPSEWEFQIVGPDGSLRMDEPYFLGDNEDYLDDFWIVPGLNSFLINSTDNIDSTITGEGFVQKFDLQGQPIWDQDRIIAYSGFKGERMPDSRGGMILLPYNNNSNIRYGFHLNYFGEYGNVLLPGDMNSDDELNIADIIQMINYCILTDNPIENCLISDFTEDQHINITDIVFMVSVILSQ